MRILIYNWKDLAHPAAGGAEVYAHRIAEEWVRQGHEVSIFCSDVAGRPPDETVNGVRVMRRGGRLSVYRAARQFWEQEGNGCFDLVIDEVNTRPFLTPSYIHDTPLVALIFQLCREIWWYEVPLPVAVLGRYWLEQRWLRLYRDVPVVTISESSRASLATYGLRDVTVVPVGIDPRRRPHVDREGVPTVLFVGRLSANKRPDHAIRAFSAFKLKCPDAKMWIVGDGPMRSRLERNRPPSVEFLGRVPDDRKRELMARAHVLVVTSVREGWGMVVDEAAAMGTPAVGYDVAGLRDSLSAASGIAVKPRPPALAEALFRQLTGLRTPPSEGGACPWPQVAQAFLEQVQEVLSKTSIQP